MVCADRRWTSFIRSWMTKDLRPRLSQAATCLLCALVVWRYGSSLEGMEFSGGRFTGFLLDMKDIGALLFVMALPLAFLYQRIAAAMTVIASLLCSPLYLYFAAPGPFRWLVRGEYSVPLQASFAWETRAMVGILVLAMATYFSFRRLLSSGDSKTRNSA